jgi:hypothetical protein
VKADQDADYVAPVLPRRPVRFFHHFIPEDGQIWLDGTAQIVNVEYTAEGWHIDVMEEGQIQGVPGE